VGSAPVSFHAHIDLLCSSSTFFSNALTGDFKEGRDKVVPMPDDEPEVFLEFLNWLYNRKHFGGMMFAFVDMLKWCKLWILADKLDVPALQNFAMESIFNKFESYDGHSVPTSTFNHVYQNSVPDSPLREVLLQFAVRKMALPFYNENVSGLEVEFLEDLCRGYMLKSAGEMEPDDVFVAHGFLIVKTKEKSVATPEFNFGDGTMIKPSNWPDFDGSLTYNETGNMGTRAFEYQEVIRDEPPGSEVLKCEYCNVSTMPEYEGFSLEELRLADYVSVASQAQAV
jgi:hypothetical protein